MGKKEQTLGHIEGEEGGGGGPKDTESHRMWTGWKQANFLSEEKQRMLFNADMQPDRYQIFASPQACHNEQTGTKRDRREA